MSDLDKCIDSKPNNNTGMHLETKPAVRLLPRVQYDRLSQKWHLLSVVIGLNKTQAITPEWTDQTDFLVNMFPAGLKVFFEGWWIYQFFYPNVM